MAPERYSQVRRMWEMAFYMANLTRSVTTWELSELLGLKKCERTDRTLRRDIQFWLDFGTIRKFPDPQHPSVVRYKWIGGLKPFLRPNETWCRSCREFRPNEEFPLVNRAMLPQCGTCRKKRAKEYHVRNKAFINARQNRNYAAKKEREHELERQGRNHPRASDSVSDQVSDQASDSVTRGVRQEGQFATGHGATAG